MTKYVNLGDSIEANRTDLITRKITKKASSLISIEGVGRFFKYTTKINSNIRITEELNPKKYKVSPQSYLDLHDELEGESLEIYTESLIPIRIESNFSHVHGAQKGSINSFTYAKILIPWRFILEKSLTN